MKYFAISIFIFFIFSLSAETCCKVKVGSDFLFTPEYISLIKNKKIGLITNHTAVNSKMQSTLSLIQQQAGLHGYSLAALFAPEHGITGSAYASEEIKDDKANSGIPIYSLHGKNRRPTPEMLKNIDVLVFDIQDIGTRSYTYITTLFLAMEAAAEQKITVVVLDRPNPINGITTDGPMLEDKWRSPVSYVNVPYCHGMTVGELAQWFNGEYQIGCKLKVVPMKGWRRSMSFAETGLPWIPTSPYIPEASTAFYYPTTGMLGELSLVNIGIGYTLPFKVVGAPWINALRFAEALNKQKFPGVHFEPFYYRPFYGKFSQEDCQGVLIMITHPALYLPVSTQYLLLGILKSLYPAQFKEALEAKQSRKEMFCKVSGTEEIYNLLTQKNPIVWKLKGYHQKERDVFRKKRQKYLIDTYRE